MYTVDGNDRVVELRDLPQSCIGAPLPVLLMDEYTLVLASCLELEGPPGWDGETARVVSPLTDDMQVALLRFSPYGPFMFGPPNDENIEDHPLGSRGLKAYGAYRVESSSWIRTLERMNSVHPEHNPRAYDDLIHYIFTFHDSTFECVARALELSQHRGPLKSAIPKMQELLCWEKYQ
jgi:hypothetical protein